MKRMVNGWKVSAKIEELYEIIGGVYPDFITAGKTYPVIYFNNSSPVIIGDTGLLYELHACKYVLSAE